eukprot:scaffold21036_cov80-Skeletonema_menzelii.AAC.10
MDLSRHKGSAYQSEASNEKAVSELNASRRKLQMDLSTSGRRKSSKNSAEAEPKAESVGGSEHAAEEAA